MKRRAQHASRRKGFVLPMVIAVGMILTFVVVALLQRINTQTLLQRKQQQKYADHHAEKGMQEAISAWLTSAASGNLDEALDEQGRAFTLSVARGQTVTVGFEESQGQLLADFAGLGQEELLDAASAVDELERIAGAKRALQLIRKEGPLGVSLRTADRAVLEAVVKAVLPGDKTGAMLSECLAIQQQLRSRSPSSAGTAPRTNTRTPASSDARAAATSTQPETIGQEARRLLDEAMGRVNVSARDRERLSKMFSTAPSLYKVWAVAESQGQPSVRYEGMALIRQGGRSGGGNSNQVQRSSAFLSWTRIEEP
jgi:hypothetical protein